MPDNPSSKKNKLEEDEFIEDKENINLDEENNIHSNDESSKFEDSLEFLGQKIRDARISNNLSLESVSGRLHISVKILEAIEEGKPENGPTPVFFRGLVRTYCQFLELDKESFIDKIDHQLRLHSEKQQIDIKPLKPVSNSKDSFPIRNLLTLFVIFIGGSLMYIIYINQTNLETNYDNVTIKELESEKVITEKQTIDNLEKNIQNKNSKNKKILASSPEKTKITKTTILPKMVSNSSLANENEEPLTLEVEASEGTWISLAIDNLATQDHRIKSDEIHQWVARKNFLLTIGNTKVVRVLLNGREIETDRTNDLLTNWFVDANLLP